MRFWLASLLLLLKAIWSPVGFISWSGSLLFFMLFWLISIILWKKKIFFLLFYVFTCYWFLFSQDFWRIALCTITQASFWILVIFMNGPFLVAFFILFNRCRYLFDWGVTACTGVLQEHCCCLPQLASCLPEAHQFHLPHLLVLHFLKIYDLNIPDR